MNKINRINVWFDGGDTERFAMDVNGESFLVPYIYEGELERELERLDVLKRIYNGEFVETTSMVVANILSVLESISEKKKKIIETMRQNPEIMGYPVLSVEHLEELCKGRNDLDCYVGLEGGRSSKHLILEDGMVNVINEIDDTSEVFDSIPDMVKNHSSIGKAMKVNSFYVYYYEVKEMI